MKKQINIRHGDLALIWIDKLPEGLTPSKGRVLLRGSNNNPHGFDLGTFYPKQVGFIVGYFVASDSTLSHPDHGDAVNKGMKYASIPDGIYELRGQQEETHEGMRAVED